MIAHYLTIACAKFRKAPFTTAANVLTLTLGLACFIAAYGIASWWRTADSYHPGADRIFVIGQSNSIIDQAGGTGAPRTTAPPNAISSWNIARYLREDFPELELVARVMPESNVPFAAGAKKTILDVAIADPQLLELFAFELVAGDPRRALSAPNSVLLTEDAAARLFGSGPALGRSVLISGVEEATVTGVFKAVRQPSFMGANENAALRFDALRDWSSSSLGAQLDLLPASWIGISPFTFVRLPPSLAVETLNARLPEFLERRVPAADRQAAQIALAAFPISELTSFLLDRALFAGGAAGVTAAGVLFALAALTLIVACVNFANLATAQAVGRAREIGMRKVLGANRAQVMTQTWIEAALLTGAALACALAVLVVAAPAIRAATGIGILAFLADGVAPIAMFAGLVVVVAFVAGAWPALVLSRFRPAAALSRGRSGTASGLAARLLVGVQFASASFLLILVTVTAVQREHLERSALAPHEDPIVVLNDLASIDVDYDTLAERLARQPQVLGVSVVDHMPWGTSYNGMFFAQSEDPAATAYPAFVKSVGYDYFETLSLPVLAGRAFDRERDPAPVSLFLSSNDPARSLPAIIDRRYAEALGFASPAAAVGQTIFMPARLMGGAARPVEIIGVTQTEWTRLEANASPGHIYTFGPRALWGPQLPLVRLARDDVAGGLAAINAVWDELAPAIPADIRFFDSLFEQSFRTYARVNQIFMLLAVAAFVIASIGQLGIAVHTASRRRHEIGVRKTLGASTLEVIRLLLVDFSKPVLVANLIAWPLAWFAAGIYLQAFANRAPLTPAPFALSMAITVIIAWAAVIGEVVKAAAIRPAEVLRHA